jgi:predicted ArsR family transcriptional regulator
MVDRRLLQLASEPVRRTVLAHLNERPAGASEVAAELEIDPSVAARHLDALHDAGLVEVVGEVLNRGAVEPRYKTLVRAHWSDEDWAALSQEEQQRLAGWILDMIESDAHAAIEQGTYTKRHDSHASRTALWVDEQGWRELTRIKQAALDGVLAVQATSAERLAETGEEGTPVLSALLCFELPLDRRGD